MISWIEVSLLFVMCGGLIGFFINRFILKKGIGVRSIQFLGLIFIMAIIPILALERIIDSQMTTTLLGTTIGFVLSGIAKDKDE